MHSRTKRRVRSVNVGPFEEAAILFQLAGLAWEHCSRGAWEHAPHSLFALQRRLCLLAARLSFSAIKTAYLSRTPTTGVGTQSKRDGDCCAKAAPFRARNAQN